MNWDEPKTIYVAVALGLVALRYLFELWLDHLNTRHVKKHANAIPEPFKEIMDEQTYPKSVRYTLAKARFGTMSDTYSTVLVIGLLFFGTIAIVFNSISTSLGESHFAQATTLWAVLWLFSLLALPFSLRSFLGQGGCRCRFLFCCHAGLIQDIPNGLHAASRHLPQVRTGTLCSFLWSWVFPFAERRASITLSARGSHVLVFFSDLFAVIFWGRVLRLL